MKKHQFLQRKARKIELNSLQNSKLAIRRAGIIFLTGFIFWVIWLLVLIKTEDKMFTISDKELTNLYVTDLSFAGGKYMSIERVNWWFNNEDNKYYLLLPSSVNTEALRLGLEGAKWVDIDGEKYTNLSKCNLTTGEHQITIDGEDNKNTLVVMKSSNLSATYLTTESGNMDYINASKDNFESGKALIINSDGEIDYAGSIESLKGRGNVTWDNSDKKGYSIKFSQKADILGLGEAKNWILLANAFDESAIRNAVVFDISRKGSLEFTPDYEYTDLYINGEYWGNYQICEKIEVNANRVDITDLGKATEQENPGVKLEEFEQFGLESVTETWTVPGTILGYQIPKEPEDITGGYLLELDIGGRYVHEDAGFVTTRNRAVVIHSPKYPSENQTKYIYNLYQEFEDAVYQFDGINVNTGKAYFEYIDVESFAKKYLVEEITKNLDAMITSQYIYKKQDSISNKLFAGPVWDYDGAIGNSKTEEAIVDENGVVDYGPDTTSPMGLYAMRDKAEAPLWYSLYYRPEFQESFKRNYIESFRENVTFEVNEGISQKASRLVESCIMNNIRWKNQTFDTIEINKMSYMDATKEVKHFLEERITYLDKEWGVNID